ncbi:MAG: energy transducer TonB [Pyrinomonadaceae bacterium]
MKFEILLTLAVFIFVLPGLRAQSRRDFPSADPKTEKVFPVLKENYVSANSDEIFTVGKVTGNIGKAEALYLSKPFYPGEAKKDAATGKIYVQITIDETGNVVAARSTDGHPALRLAAEESARASKFRASVVDDQHIKTDGWLIYNFEIEKSNWIKIAYDLAFLHTPVVNQKLALAGMKGHFTADWTTENDLLGKLEELVAQMPVPEKIDELPMLTTQTTTKNGAVFKGQTFSRRLPAIPSPNPEQIAVTQNLITALQSRLADNEAALWQFNLTFAILKDANFSRDPNEPRPKPETLMTFLANTPKDISPEYTEELKILIELLESSRQFENDQKIQNSIIKLQKLK